MISNCGQDENGGLNGVAGDQTTREYSLIPWFNCNWTGVLRYTGEKATAVRKAITKVAINAAKNDHIGYSQSERQTYYEELKKCKWDSSKITKNCNSDCSASSTAAVIAAGHLCKITKLANLSQYQYTGSMVNAFTAVGFVWLTDSKYTSSADNLIPGDILLNTSQHAAVWVGDGKTGFSGSTPSDDIGSGGGPIDLKDAIAKLYTSDNYKFVSGSATEQSERQKKKKEAIKNAAVSSLSSTNAALNDKEAAGALAALFKSTVKAVVLNRKNENIATKEKRLQDANLTSFPNLVEAPFIEVNLNGITIGGYNNEEDKYPNHIVSMDIDKINGRINQYSISIVHQVRAGEDPNFIDSLLARTGIRNKIQIKYGDSAYGAFFKEEEAYITDVTYNEDVNSAKITYVISAVSSVGAGKVQEAYFNFPKLQTKPSAEIVNMLYKDKQTSEQLLEYLGGMRNEKETLSNGYIPQDDAEVTIPSLENASLLDRLTQLVSYMYDPVTPGSSYFMAFEDKSDDKAFFKIKKLTKTEKSDAAVKNCYYLDVGYPGNSFVTKFSLQQDVYWPIYFKYAGTIPTYLYDIDYSGNLITQQVNPLTIDNKYGTFSVRDANWWDLTTNYPIIATTTIKGLMKPVALIENVYVYAQFYGQEDMASGLYSIIGQHDSISGAGYTTTLQLLRVQNN